MTPQVSGKWIYNNAEKTQTNHFTITGMFARWLWIFFFWVKFLSKNLSSTCLFWDFFRLKLEYFHTLVCLVLVKWCWRMVCLVVTCFSSVSLWPIVPWAVRLRLLAAIQQIQAVQLCTWRLRRDMSHCSFKNFRNGRRKAVLAAANGDLDILWAHLLQTISWFKKNHDF